MNRSIHAGLDRPSWAALTTRQAHLGAGDELARRYHPNVAPFAALACETASIDDQDVIQLGIGDVNEMLDLVQKTKPGPFGKRTCEMGAYIGIRDQGRLIAMAGERMRLDGHVEISAVRVDEGWR